MTALVTGVSGFVGAHLARYLAGTGTTVHGLCRESSDLSRITDVPITLHKSELLDVANVIREIRPEQVFHLAGAPLAGGAASAIETNVLGTMALVDACVAASVPSIVLTGDAFEYGPSPQRRRETDPCRPDDVHGLTNLAATRYGQAMARTSDVAITTIRLFSIYGPGDNPSRLVPRLLDAAARGVPVPLSDPAVVRDWVHVDDLVQLYARVAAEPALCGGRVLNAGSGQPTTIEDLVRAVERAKGRTLDVRWGEFPTAPNDFGWWVADPSLTDELLGWRATTALDDGLAAM